MGAAATIDEVMTAFTDHKRANDARLDEIEKHGQESAEAKAAAERAVEALAKVKDQIEADQGKTEERIEEIENRLNRPKAGGLGINDIPKYRLESLARWQASVSGKDTVSLEEIDLAKVSDYNRAYRAYLRYGDRATVDTPSGQRSATQVMNEMSEGSNPDGGYYVSPDLTGRPAMLRYETSPIRTYASVQVIATDSLEGPKDLDEADAGWVGETTSRTDTDTPQIGMWEIKLHEQYAQPRVTQRLLDDTRFDLEGWLASKVGDKMRRNENSAAVTGTGVLKPRGFTTYTAGTPSASTWDVIAQVNSGHATQLTADGIRGASGLIFSIKSDYLDGAIFGMNRLTWSNAAGLKDGNGNYLLAPDFSERAMFRLCGFPVVEFPDMANVGASALPIVFGNLREAYQLVDHAAGMRTLRDPFTAKPYVRYYTTKRTGGGVINFEAIALQKVSA